MKEGIAERRGQQRGKSGQRDIIPKHETTPADTFAG